VIEETMITIRIEQGPIKRVEKIRKKKGGLKTEEMEGQS